MLALASETLALNNPNKKPGSGGGAGAATKQQETAAKAAKEQIGKQGKGAAEAGGAEAETHSFLVGTPLPCVVDFVLYSFFARLLSPTFSEVFELPPEATHPRLRSWVESMQDHYSTAAVATAPASAEQYRAHWAGS